MGTGSPQGRCVTPQEADCLVSVLGGCGWAQVKTFSRRRTLYKQFLFVCLFSGYGIIIVFGGHLRRKRKKHKRQFSVVDCFFSFSGFECIFGRTFENYRIKSSVSRRKRKKNIKGALQPLFVFFSFFWVWNVVVGASW